MEIVIAFLIVAAIVVLLTRYIRNIEVRDDLHDDYDSGPFPRRSDADPRRAKP